MFICSCHISYQCEKLGYRFVEYKTRYTAKQVNIKVKYTYHHLYENNLIFDRIIILLRSIYECTRAFWPPKPK